VRGVYRLKVRVLEGGEGEKLRVESYGRGKEEIQVEEANLLLLLFSCCFMNEVDHVSFFYLCLVM